MESARFEGLYGRELTIDLCAACQGIWFDEGESLQLSPHGTLALFRTIGERRPQGRRPLAERLECARCDLRLSLTVDRQRTTKFQYYRCGRGHGRFMTFFQFLRARNFVRSLTPREVADVKAKVKQVTCSNCGAAIDLDRDVACQYCRAPVSMLDPEQIERTLAELREADERRRHLPPDLPLTLMAERLKVERVFAEASAAGGRELGVTFTTGGPGLVEAGIGVLLHWLAPRRE
jgi:hypothetical protein